MASGCSKEPPARTVEEFMANELLLEAALVRCTQNRAEMRYEEECVNAREAANLIESREVEARRAELEAQSEQKREALRRNQEAAAEARRLAAEARQRREEAEYLAQFGEVPPGTSTELTGNEPGVVIPRDPSATDGEGGYQTGDVYIQPYEPMYENDATTLPTAGSNAPTVQIQPPPETEPYAEPVPELQSEPEPEPVVEPVVEAEEAPNDLQSIRDELRRRNDDGN